MDRSSGYKNEIIEHICHIDENAFNRFPKNIKLRCRVKCVSELKKLKYLGLARTNVKDLTPLAGLVLLEELSLQETPVTDINPLKEMTKLRILKIYRTSVQDISIIKQLISLEEIWASETNINDISSLTNLKNLKIVDFKDCPLDFTHKEIYRILEANNPGIKYWEK